MAIQLIIANTTVALPSGMKVNREFETMLFQKDGTAYDFNYPVELPLSDDLRRALGFPDLLANPATVREFAALLKIDDLDIRMVTVVVLGVNLATKTLRVSIKGEYASLKDVFGTKRVCDLSMGGPVLLGDDESDSPMTHTMPQHVWDEDATGAFADYGEFRVTYRGTRVNTAMTKIAKGITAADFCFPTAIDYGGAPDSKDGVNVINAWDEREDRYVDADLLNFWFSKWKYFKGLSRNPTEGTQRHFWVPMYKLAAVLRAIFTEHGLTYEGDIFSDAKFEKLILYNTCAINTGYAVDHHKPGGAAPWYFTCSIGSDKAFIIPGNHLPTMEIVEFLIELGKRFNLQFRYDALTKKVTVRKDNDIFSAPDNIIDVTARANPVPNILFDSSNLQLNGYEFSNADDPEDDYLFEITKDITGKTIIGEVDTIGALAGYVAATDELVFVKNEGAYYIKVDATSGGGFEFYSFANGRFATASGDNLQRLECKIVAQPMGTEAVETIDRFPGGGAVLWLIGAAPFDRATELYPKSNIGMSFWDKAGYNYIDWDRSNDRDPYWGIGINNPWTERNFTDKTPPKEILPHLLSYEGFKISSDGHQYPYATTIAHDINASSLDNYPGIWHTPGGRGTYDDWWKAFVTAVQGSIAVEWDILLDAVTMSSLDPDSTQLIIAGLRWLVRKGSVVFPLPEISRLELIRT